VLLFAHGIVGRADPPIPETLFGAAAAAVLVVSFVALALGWSKPRLKRLPEKDLFVLFLSNRVHPSGAGATNALQGRSVTVDYLWSEVQAKKK